MSTHVVARGPLFDGVPGFSSPVRLETALIRLLFAPPCTSIFLRAPSKQRPRCLAYTRPTITDDRSACPPSGCAAFAAPPAELSAALAAGLNQHQCASSVCASSCVSACSSVSGVAALADSRMGSGPSQTLNGESVTSLPLPAALPSPVVAFVTPHGPVPLPPPEPPAAFAAPLPSLPAAFVASPPPPPAALVAPALLTPSTPSAAFAAPLSTPICALPTACDSTLPSLPRAAALPSLPSGLEPPASSTTALAAGVNGHHDLLPPPAALTPHLHHPLPIPPPPACLPTPSAICLTPRAAAVSTVAAAAPHALAVCGPPSRPGNANGPSAAALRPVREALAPPVSRAAYDAAVARRDAGTPLSLDEATLSAALSAGIASPAKAQPAPTALPATDIIKTTVAISCANREGDAGDVDSLRYVSTASHPTSAIVGDACPESSAPAPHIPAQMNAQGASGFAVRVLLFRCFRSILACSRGYTGGVHSLPCTPPVHEQIRDGRKIFETRVVKASGQLASAKAGDLLCLNGSLPTLCVVLADAALTATHVTVWRTYGRLAFPSLPEDATDADVWAFAFSLYKRRYGSLNDFKASFSESLPVTHRSMVAVMRVQYVPREFHPMPWHNTFDVLSPARRGPPMPDPTPCPALCDAPPLAPAARRSSWIGPEVGVEGPKGGPYLPFFVFGCKPLSYEEDRALTQERAALPLLPPAVASQGPSALPFILGALAPATARVAQALLASNVRAQADASVEAVQRRRDERRARFGGELIMDRATVDIGAESRVARNAKVAAFEREAHPFASPGFALSAISDLAGRKNRERALALATRVERQSLSRRPIGTGIERRPVLGRGEDFRGWFSRYASALAHAAPSDATLTTVRRAVQELRLEHFYSCEDEDGEPPALCFTSPAATPSAKDGRAGQAASGVVEPALDVGSASAVDAGVGRKALKSGKVQCSDGSTNASSSEGLAPEVHAVRPSESNASQQVPRSGEAISSSVVQAAIAPPDAPPLVPVDVASYAAAARSQLEEKPRPSPAPPAPLATVNVTTTTVRRPQPVVWAPLVIACHHSAQFILSAIGWVPVSIKRAYTIEGRPPPSPSRPGSIGVESATYAERLVKGRDINSRELRDVRAVNQLVADAGRRAADFANELQRRDVQDRIYTCACRLFGMIAGSALAVPLANRFIASVDAGRRYHYVSQPKPLLSLASTYVTDYVKLGTAKFFSKDTVSPAFSAWEVQPQKPLGVGGFGCVLPLTQAVQDELSIPSSYELSAVCKVQQASKIAAAESRLLDRFREDMSLPPCVSWCFAHGIHAFPGSSHVRFTLMPRYGSDLYKLITQPALGFTDGAMRCLMADALTAVAYLHKFNIAHFDIKPENFLLRYSEGDMPSPSNGLVLGDFGLAKVVDPSTREYATLGTYGYMAPEVEGIGPLHKEGSTILADVWSLACTIVEMWHRLPSMGSDIRWRGINLEWHRDNSCGVPTDLERFVKGSLCAPSKRCTIQQLIHMLPTAYSTLINTSLWPWEPGFEDAVATRTEAYMRSQLIRSTGKSTRMCSRHTVDSRWRAIESRDELVPTPVSALDLHMSSGCQMRQLMLAHRGVSGLDDERWDGLVASQVGLGASAERGIGLVGAVEAIPASSPAAPPGDEPQPLMGLLRDTIAGFSEDHRAAARCVFERAVNAVPWNFDEDTRSLSVLDMFSGMGGLSAGFIGQFDSIQAIEMSATRANIYRGLLGFMGGDPCVYVHTCTGRDPLPPNSTINRAPWVLVGGAPCQPFSRMGKQRGADDPRNGYPAVMAAVAELSPPIVLLEQVENVILHEDVVRDIVQGLRSMGYFVRVHVCNAVHYGTPQLRVRLIFVACKFMPIDAPPWTVTEAVSVGEALDPYGSFLVGSAGAHPELVLTEAQIAVIKRFELQSRVRRSRDLVRSLPSRGVTASNTVGVTGSTMRLLLDDGETRRRLTPGEVGVLQGFDFEHIGMLVESGISERQILLALGDAVPVQLSRAWACHLRGYIDEWCTALRELRRLLDVPPRLPPLHPVGSLRAPSGAPSCEDVLPAAMALQLPSRGRGDRGRGRGRGGRPGGKGAFVPPADLQQPMLQPERLGADNIGVRLYQKMAGDDVKAEFKHDREIPGLRQARSDKDRRGLAHTEGDPPVDAPVEPLPPGFVLRVGEQASTPADTADLLAVHSAHAPDAAAEKELVDRQLLASRVHCPPASKDEERQQINSAIRASLSCSALGTAEGAGAEPAVDAVDTGAPVTAGRRKGKGKQRIEPARALPVEQSRSMLYKEVPVDEVYDTPFARMARGESGTSWLKESPLAFTIRDSHDVDQFNDGFVHLLVCPKFAVRDCRMLAQYCGRDGLVQDMLDQGMAAMTGLLQERIESSLSCHAGGRPAPLLDALFQPGWHVECRSGRPVPQWKLKCADCLVGWHYPPSIPYLHLHVIFPASAAQHHDSWQPPLFIPLAEWCCSHAPSVVFDSTPSRTQARELRALAAERRAATEQEAACVSGAPEAPDSHASLPTVFGLHGSGDLAGLSSSGSPPPHNGSCDEDGDNDDDDDGSAPQGGAVCCSAHQPAPRRRDDGEGDGPAGPGGGLPPSAPLIAAASPASKAPQTTRGKGKGRATGSRRSRSHEALLPSPPAPLPGLSDGQLSAVTGWTVSLHFDVGTDGFVAVDASVVDTAAPGLDGCSATRPAEVRADVARPTLALSVCTLQQPLRCPSAIHLPEACSSIDLVEYVSDGVRALWAPSSMGAHLLLRVSFARAVDMSGPSLAHCFRKSPWTTALRRFASAFLSSAAAGERLGFPARDIGSFTVLGAMRWPVPHLVPSLEDSEAGTVQGAVALVLRPALGAGIPSSIQYLDPHHCQMRRDALVAAAAARRSAARAAALRNDQMRRRAQHIAASLAPHDGRHSAAAILVQRAARRAFARARMNALRSRGRGSTSERGPAAFDACTVAPDAVSSLAAAAAGQIQGWVRRLLSGQPLRASTPSVAPPALHPSVKELGSVCMPVDLPGPRAAVLDAEGGLSRCLCQFCENPFFKGPGQYCTDCDPCASGLHGCMCCDSECSGAYCRAAAFLPPSPPPSPPASLPPSPPPSPPSSSWPPSPPPSPPPLAPSAGPLDCFSVPALAQSAEAMDRLYSTEAEFMDGYESDSSCGSGAADDDSFEAQPSHSPPKFSAFTPRAAYGIFRTLLAGALATMGGSLGHSEQHNAVATGADAAQLWRSTVQEQMRSECYSRQSIYEMGNNGLRDSMGRHMSRGKDVIGARMGVPQRTVSEAVFRPCTFANAAYRRTEIQDGCADLRRIRNMLVDLGASISVLDKARAERMEREGAAEIVRYGHSVTVPARVAGGGYIAIVGIATIEFCLQDTHSGEWQVFKERFHLVEGSKTCILGMTFHAQRDLQLDLNSGQATYSLDNGAQFSTEIDIYAPGMVATAVVSSDPLVFTREKHTVVGWGFSTIKCAVPESFNGSVIQLTRLPELSAFVNKMGLSVPECTVKVKDGFITIPVHNPGSRPVEVPPMVPLGRFSADMEIRSASAHDMTVEQIVDALHIESVDPGDLARKKADVALLITAMRQGYFSEYRLGRCSVGEFHVESPTVDSGGVAPPNIPSRPLNKEQLEAARKEFDKMVEQGVLVPSTSPWGAPIVMVRKPKGGWRLCLDYRAGNAVAVKQHYPLPRVQDCIDRIGNASYFASLDVLKAFWQIPNSTTTQPKTAVNFPWGKYEFRTMPMGMQAASATYQRVMDVLLRDLDFCVGYIDDALIYSDTWENHLTHVALVLDRIGGAGLTLNPGKCEIGKSSVPFLGHLISSDGNRPDPGKLKVIRDAEFPKSKKDMHHWVSLAGFYAPFMDKFAVITEPIHAYIHTRPRMVGNKAVHDPPEPSVREAFDKIKSFLCNDLVLARPDFNAPFILKLDASVLHGMGSILAQEIDGVERPVCYWSTRWIESTSNWAPVEHECFAFRKACDRYYEYLSSNHFTVYTDSEPLQWLNTLRRPRGRMATWILELQPLDYTVIHRAGRLNLDCDALSRLALASSSILGKDRLTATTPFEAASVALVTAPQRGWRRRLIAAVVTDGHSVLVLPSYDGGGSFHCFPTVVKESARSCNRALALRALILASGRAADSSTFECSELGDSHVIKGEATAYVVFRCTALTVRELLLTPWAGERTAQWMPLGEVSVASPDDARTVGRLSANHHPGAGGLREVRHAAALAVDALQMAQPLVRPGCLPDGRSIPDRALHEAEEVYDALRQISLHMSAVQDSSEDFLVVDLEFDMLSYGVDLVQIAAGRLIFVFDILRNSTPLTAFFVSSPAQPDTLPAVPGLRHWFTRPGTALVMQACGNDARKLHWGYSIQLTGVFDTQYADAILCCTSDGRRLGLLVKHYLQQDMRLKAELVHCNGQFKQRPLPRRLLDYAWQDVVYGAALYRSMRSRLLEHETCAVLELSRQRADTPVDRPLRAVVLWHNSTHCLAPDLELTEVSVPLFEGTARLSLSTIRSRLYKRVSELVADALASEPVLTSTGAPVASVKDLLGPSLGKPKQVGPLLCFFAQGGGLLQANAWAVSRLGWVYSSLFDCVSGQGTPLGSQLHRVACRAWYGCRHLRGGADVRASSLGAKGTEVPSSMAVQNVQGDLHEEAAAMDIQRVWRGALARSHRRYSGFLRRWASCCAGSLSLLQPSPALATINTAAAKAPDQFTYSELSGEEIRSFERQAEACEIPGLSQVSESLTAVVIVAHGGGQLLTLERNPTTQAARVLDGSRIALPSLKTTSELYGKYRAQHALSMLFGPVRSYSETIGAYESLRLRGVIRESAGRQVIGVYECDLDPSSFSMLPTVFSQRRLTPTMAALHPGFALREASVEGLNAVDSLAVSCILNIGLADSPSVSGFDPVETPGLPDPKRQKDLSRAAKKRQRRVQMPGVQPSGLDVQEDTVAEYPDGSRVPRARNVTDLFRSLMPTEGIPDPKELAELQKADPVCTYLRLCADATVQGDKRPAPPEELRKVTRSMGDIGFVVVDDLLYMSDDYGADASDAQPHLRVVLPECIQQDFMKSCHDGLGHPGVKRTLRAVRSRVWWPGVRKRVKEFVRLCPTCLFNKVTPHKGKQHIPDNGAHPWHSVQMDIVHLHKSRSGMEKALVFYDRFTRDVEAFAVRGDVDTDTVLSIVLFELYPRHGAFKVLYTDRGSNLISEEAQEFYLDFGIVLRPADAEMHTAVAGAERFNATLRELARAAHFDHGYEWDLVLPLLVYWYKQLVQTASGYSPFFLNHGRDPTALPWDLMHGPNSGSTSSNADVRKRFAMMHLAWQCAQAEITRQEDERRAEHSRMYQTNLTFAKNERVLIRQAGRSSKMDMPFVGPFRIEEVLERDRYRVVGRQGAKHLHHEFHISRLKLWPAGADAEDVYLDESYYDVEKIVGHRRNKKGALEFRVRWQGFTAEDDTFLALEDMNAALGREAYEYMKEHVPPDPRGGSASPPAPKVPSETLEIDNGTEQSQAETQEDLRLQEQTDARQARLDARQRRMGNASASD